MVAHPEGLVRGDTAPRGAPDLATFFANLERGVDILIRGAKVQPTQEIWKVNIPILEGAVACWTIDFITQ
jgi:hypothetical protein